MDAFLHVQERQYMKKPRGRQWSPYSLTSQNNQFRVRSELNIFFLGLCFCSSVRSINGLRKFAVQRFLCLSSFVTYCVRVQSAVTMNTFELSTQCSVVTAELKFVSPTFRRWSPPSASRRRFIKCSMRAVHIIFGKWKAFLFKCTASIVLRIATQPPPAALGHPQLRPCGWNTWLWVRQFFGGDSEWYFSRVGCGLSCTCFNASTGKSECP